jgi:hypothetical protein
MPLPKPKPVRVVLTTSEIFRTWGDGAPLLVIPEPHPGHGDMSIFSTGTLERALAAGLDVWVVSTRMQFGDHDAWWRELVRPDQVFKGESEEDRQDCNRPWRRCWAAMNIPWGPPGSGFEGEGRGRASWHPHWTSVRVDAVKGGLLAEFSTRWSGAQEPY